MKKNIDYKKDIFLSKQLNKECYIINHIINNSKIPKRFEFAYIKTNNNFNNYEFLRKNNFYLVEINIKLNLNLKNYKFKNKDCLLADNKDEKMIKAIASKSFINDRFHNDKKISNKVASKIKREWAANFFRGLRGNQCFVIKEKKNLLGFLISNVNNKKGIIDLIAVDKKYRNKGVGKKLITSMINYYRNKINVIEVGTQLNNIESLNFYQKLGFKIISHKLTYHYHKY